MSALAEGVARLLTKLALRSCDHVGFDARVAGRPDIANQGRMTIGDGFEMSAVPVRSHLATGPDGQLEIGDRVRIAHGVSIFADRRVVLENDVAIAPFAMILDVDFHEVKDHDSRGTARPIRIGRGVRIGTGAVILRGAIIGDGARIAPGSVVSRHVPAGAVAAGVPAKPLPTPPKPMAKNDLIEALATVLEGRLPPM